MKNLEINFRHLLAGVALGALTVTGAPAIAQDDKPEKPAVEKKQDEKKDVKAKDGDKKADKKAKDKKKKKKKEKYIKDVVKDHEVIDGLFKLYRDPKTGSLSMEITEDQIGKEFIYFSHIENGVVEGGHFRGQYRAQKVFKINKHYDKIEFVEQNPNFYFDENNALSKAKDANISNSVIAVSKIKAKNDKKEHEADGKRYLVNADSLFKSEAFDKLKPRGNPRAKPWENFSLGKVSKSKTRVSSVKNYPENTAVTVDYVFSNPSPANGGRGFEITDARNVNVRMQHTLLAMPENDFKPRFDDARVGYFLDYVNDMTSHSATPWRDLINRWHLVKKDPSAAVSEPVEPIVWWMENTTPAELRPVIKKAVESWNVAFEAAGFKNAVVVKQQPDDADWDAGDIRYNTLRWTSSPTPPFGGYGPSFSNPYTGQILGADIMLEYSFITNRLRQSEVFETAGAAMHEEHTDETASFMDRLRSHEASCNMAGQLQLNNMVGNALALAQGRDEAVSKKLVEESIYYLMLHEVGHTLGLNHNMKATQARSYESTYDISAQGNGLAGSVMDYPAINFAPKGKDQPHYYTVRPGDYDIWAIQFGYSPDMDDEATREAHLARSNEKGLAFGNDADDMRAPGRGIDPRVNIFDMTDDAVRFAEDRLKMDEEALKGLKKKFTTEGESYQELRNAYFVVTGDMFSQGNVASRYIGGVYVDRSVAGQAGATAPYRPVEEEKQRKAMKLLNDYIFAPNAFEASSDLLQHIGIQRRGFFHFAGEDPRVHARIGRFQAGVLAHVMHPVTLRRISDSTLYGNTYSVTEVMNDLTAAVFDADSRGAVNTLRQQLQLYYVNGLIGMMKGPNYDYVAKSNALANLRKIGKNMARWRGDAATRAHRDHVAFIINKALEVHEG